MESLHNFKVNVQRLECNIINDNICFYLLTNIDRKNVKLSIIKSIEFESIIVSICDLYVCCWIY